MTKEQFLETVRKCFCALDDNRVLLPEEGVEVPVMEEPLIGFASADDPLFAEFPDPQIIGPDFRAPKEWLPEAKTVAVMFIPFTEDIRSRHGSSPGPVDEAWTNGYRKHQQLTEAFLDLLTAELDAQGVRYLVPTRDPAFHITPVPVKSRDADDVHYSSAWSNRHAGFVAGLGTFGIHRHLITDKGCCGGFACVITDCELKPTARRYEGVYEYCTRCGACMERCPAGAITAEHLRNLRKCSEQGAAVREKFGGFCGRCLAGIPCEHRNPSAEE